MKGFVSIKRKLVLGAMAIIALIFSVVISVMIARHTATVEKRIRDSETRIRDSIILTGTALTGNNSIAVRGMAEDNAFGAVRDLVAATVAVDPSIAYGIFMDADHKPWATASEQNPSAIPESAAPLGDPAAIWAGSLEKPAHNLYTSKNTEIIEFAAPVTAGGEKLGTIRYGFSTRAMKEAMEEVVGEARSALFRAVLFLLGSGLLFLALSYLAVRRLAERITRPVEALVTSARKIARGDYDTDIPTAGNDELGLLVTHVNRMRRAIKGLTENLEAKVSRRTEALRETSARLASANAEITALNRRLTEENLRMAAELDVARRLQEMVLPSPADLPDIPELDIACFMKPADEVGGDYYDLLVREERVFIGIGDVTGHGLAGCVLMLMAQTAVRSLILAGIRDPGEFLSILNNTLLGNLLRMNMDRTLSFSLIDYRKGAVRVFGQHETLIILRESGRVESVDTVDLGFPLGLLSEIREFAGETGFRLEQGDALLLYTDGITEAENPRGELYDTHRLEGIAARARGLCAEGIKDAVIRDIGRHTGDAPLLDDMSLIVLKRQPPRGGENG